MLSSVFNRKRNGNVFSSFRLIFPLVMAMSANAINQFADRVFLAHYSDVAIQSSLPGGMLSWLSLCLLITTVGYSGTLVAQFYGAGSRHDAKRAFVQGLWLCAACIPLLLASIPFGNWIFDLIGHAPAVKAAEKTYYGILQLGGSFCILGAVLSGYFTGIGKTRIVGIANVAGNLVNIALDWALIFGRCGFSEHGIAGAGWATAISAVVPCVILAAAYPATDKAVALKTSWKMDFKLIGRILHYGIPSGIHIFLDCATFTVFVMIIGGLDAMSSAVSTICFAINHLSFAPLTGLCQGATMLVGQFQGEGDSAAAARSANSCLFLGMAYAVFFIAFILIFPDQCMNFFHGEASEFPLAPFRALGRRLLMILAGWVMFDAIIMVLEGALKGAGDTRYVMLVQCGVSFLAWMPLVFIVNHFHPDVVWLWATMPVYCALCAILILLRYRTGRWRRIKMVQDIIRRPPGQTLRQA